MKHVSILTPRGHSSISHIESTFQIFSHVNAILEERGKSHLFAIQLAGLNNTSELVEDRFKATPDILINDIAKTELIIIPAMIGNPNKSIELNHGFIPWIKKQRQNGAEIASFCIGAFF